MGRPMTTDSLSRFNSLVKSSPFLAQLVEPMCALLNHAAQIEEAFCNAEEEGLGHLETKLQKPLATLKAELLRRAAQQLGLQRGQRFLQLGFQMAEALLLGIAERLLDLSGVVEQGAHRLHQLGQKGRTLHKGIEARQ